MLRFLASIIFTSVILAMLVSCAENEEKLINKHCAGLQGYNFSHCAASIY